MFDQFTKAFEGFQTPNFDSSEVFAQQRKAVEAATQATKAFTEGAQKAMKQSADFARQNFEAGIKVQSEVSNAGSPDQTAKKLSDLSQDYAKTSMEQFRKVSETVTKAQFEAFDILNKRMNETLKEAATTVKKAA